MKHAVITGPTGAIGMALIQELVQQNIKVTALVNPDSSRKNQILDDPLIASKKDLVEVVELGLDQFGEGREGSGDGEKCLNPRPHCLKECPNCLQATFFHLAWAGTIGPNRNDAAIQQKNVDFALDAVRFAHSLGCTHFIGVGSQAEYGRVEGKLSADTPCNPENEYGKAKLKACQETKALCEELGMAHTWVRVLSVYGPYDGPRTMISSIADQLLNGMSPEATKGEQLWDYIYSKDAARALRLIAENVDKTDGKLYPIGSGKARPLKEYMEELRDAVVEKLGKDEVDVPVIAYGFIPYSENQVMHLEADITELSHDTGFVPEYEFSQGIRETILGK